MTQKKHLILLHGLNMQRLWMLGFKRALGKEGYEVHDISYPSRDKDPRQLVDEHILPLVQSLPKGEKIDFVVHSLGAILTRMYAAQYGTERIGRVVMLGPPNKGSQVADYLKQWKIFPLFVGEGGKGLGTGDDDIQAQLPPVNFECGVIAGTNHLVHFPANVLAEVPLPNDGLVSVESTKVEGMADHITLHVDHSTMVWTPAVWKLAISFLKNGCFERPEPSASADGHSRHKDPSQS